LSQRRAVKGANSPCAASDEPTATALANTVVAMAGGIAFL
jgi:hypothetical protein